MLSGDVPPGTAIPVAEVAGHFGVSHIPVREALKTLAAEQLVEHRRNAGYAVATLTWAELRELYVVRGVLEAAALAGAVALAEEADDAALAAALAALDGAIRDRDHRAYHRETRRFHFAMLDPCRMSRLLHVLRSVWNLTEPYQSMAHITDADRARLHAEHARMCAAFMARDAAALARLADDHQHDLEESIAGLPADGRLFAEGRPPADCGCGADRPASRAARVAARRRSRDTHHRRRDRTYGVGTGMGRMAERPITQRARR